MKKRLKINNFNRNFSLNSNKKIKNEFDLYSLNLIEKSNIFTARLKNNKNIPILKKLFKNYENKTIFNLNKHRNLSNENSTFFRDFKKNFHNKKNKFFKENDFLINNNNTNFNINFHNIFKQNPILKKNVIEMTVDLKLNPNSAEKNIK